MHGGTYTCNAIDRMQSTRRRQIITIVDDDERLARSPSQRLSHQLWTSRMHRAEEIVCVPISLHVRSALLMWVYVDATPSRDTASSTLVEKNRLL